MTTCANRAKLLLASASPQGDIKHGALSSDPAVFFKARLTFSPLSLGPILLLSQMQFPSSSPSDLALSFLSAFVQGGQSPQTFPVAYPCFCHVPMRGHCSGLRSDISPSPSRTTHPSPGRRASWSHSLSQPPMALPVLMDCHCQAGNPLTLCPA